MTPFEMDIRFDCVIVTHWVQQADLFRFGVVRESIVFSKSYSAAELVIRVPIE